MKRIFITGISTEVGKTIASAIAVEALQADYWKPVQAGDPGNGDRQKVSSLISNKRTVIHPCSYELKTPMSPHAAAEIDGVHIDPELIVEPITTNHLIIEGAGGLLVPLNESDTVLDLIKPGYKVILVSRHYLGSINHTLLSIMALLERGLEVFLLFNGNEHPSTEDIIVRRTKIPVIGRIGEEALFNQQLISTYAGKFKAVLESL